MKKFLIILTLIITMDDGWCQEIDNFIGKYAVTDRWCVTIFTPNYCDTSYSEIEIEKKSENEIAILHFHLYDDTLYATVDSDSFKFSQTFYASEYEYLIYNGSGKLTNDTLVYKYTAGGPSGLFEGICTAVKINDNTVSYKEFAPIGAEWYYCVPNELGNPLYSYENYISEKDTLINGKVCKSVSSKHNNEIMLAEQGKVFYFFNGQFNLIYDFTAEVGDTINFSFKSFKTNATTIDTVYTVKCVVEKIDSTIVNKNALRKFHTRILKRDDLIHIIWDTDYTYYERIGYEYNFMYILSIPSLGYKHNLRCFKDDKINFVSDWWASQNKACDYSFLSSSLYYESFDSNIKITPNPATDEISVEFDDWMDIDNPVALLYDVIGNLKIETSIQSCKTSINLLGLLAGDYIVIITSGKRMIGYEKFIKK